MTNTSPLEVHYKWYFLRRPPVRRQDPEQLDEGVDMQSECETDSLTEGEVESQEEGETEQEEGEEEDDASESMEGGKEEGTTRQHEGEREGSEVGETIDHSGRQSQVSHETDEESQGSKLEGSGPKEPAIDAAEQRDDISTVSDVAPIDSEDGTTDQTPGSIDADKDGERHSELTAHVGREKQPWELVDDPFTLLRIEQVHCIYTHVHDILMHMYMRISKNYN